MTAHSLKTQPDPPIGIIGSGIAGLITAQVLLQDGFNVEVLTRDKSVGGVWSKERIYSGLRINSVHGEFRFSAMQMRAPDNSVKTGGRLSGEDVRQYMEDFKEQYLKDKIRFETEVLNIRRGDHGRGWEVLVRDGVAGGTERVSYYSRIILCTGGYSNPHYPVSLTPDAAKAARFSGPVLHSMHFSSRIKDLLACTTPVHSHEAPGAPSIVIIGGGKSAQDSAAYLAREGRPVTMIFDSVDAFLASSTPLPPYIRKSRFLSVMSPHRELRSRLERFLHTTWLGAAIVHCFWNALAMYSFYVLGVSRDSPLRRTHSLFWNTRTNDEGIPSEGSFHALAVSGKISLVARTRVAKFGDDSVILDDGSKFPAAAVILATGYQSTWRPIFDEISMEQLGLGRPHPDLKSPHLKTKYRWDYASLANPPDVPGKMSWSASIYRGLVPAKNILNRDFAVNGAMFSAHHTYVCEVSAHWISAYFRGDVLRLPQSIGEAIDAAQYDGEWVQRRYPHSLNWISESNSSTVAFWTWPQVVDDLLEDMGVRAMRSGGSWASWPFKAINLDEISNLKAERDQANGRREIRA
ncbi:FAD/NAD-P-binding domain-containing protein [Russula ochroleuca]|uniref:FAD/NAD-P-binding domain-containing protein n=1 Tax=Russula ochroleuca TaxID=152965 RepID=A0A9P5MM23_9AGAM|nr:FAD/NAD-P-binding domain-containing protein [Russula ochroleuca]